MPAGFPAGIIFIIFSLHILATAPTQAVAALHQLPQMAVCFQLQIRMAELLTYQPCLF